MLVGLQAVAGDNLTAIVNTADDTEIYGVHVSPDVDIVTYWLAGIADEARGWGIRDDTFAVIQGFAALGQETWFSLGDRDFATCLYRTERLGAGDPLSAITNDIRSRLGVTARILPMTNVSTKSSYMVATALALESRPELRSNRSAGPFSAAPPTMGLTAMTWGWARKASRTPGKARMGSTDSSGFDGQMITFSARSIAGITPSAGVASEIPANRISATSGSHLSLTKYSWNSSVRLSDVTMFVAT